MMACPSEAGGQGGLGGGDPQHSGGLGGRAPQKKLQPGYQNLLFFIRVVDAQKLNTEGQGVGPDG